ncbi:hypothetical protein JYT78_01270 [bacterium AH-315-I20]|nr:hypothetical protein [bacterium AH-315-I20]
MTLLFSTTIYGLLKRKIWGYKLAIALYTVLICFEVLRLTISGMRADALATDIVIQLQAICFAAWILAYLKKEKIKAWFNVGHSGTEKVPSAQEQMEEEVASVWKIGRNGMFFCAFVFLMPVTIWLSGKTSPVPELSDMSITEGMLINVTSGTRRGSSPYLILKEDNGLVSSFRVARAEYYRPYVGGRVKVWSTEYCQLFGAVCFESAFQAKYTNKYAQYKNKLILDYKDVRGHMEKNRYELGFYDYFFGGIALIFVLLGIVVFYDTKRKIKKIQDRYRSEEVGG